MPTQGSDQDRIYRQAAEIYGAALERLARAYEADAEVGATFCKKSTPGYGEASKDSISVVPCGRGFVGSLTT